MVYQAISRPCRGSDKDVSGANRKHDSTWNSVELETPEVFRCSPRPRPRSGWEYWLFYVNVVC